MPTGTGVQMRPPELHSWTALSAEQRLKSGELLRLFLGPSHEQLRPANEFGSLIQKDLNIIDAAVRDRSGQRFRSHIELCSIHAVIIVHDEIVTNR